MLVSAGRPEGKVRGELNYEDVFSRLCLERRHLCQRFMPDGTSQSVWYRT